MFSTDRVWRTTGKFLRTFPEWRHQNFKWNDEVDSSDGPADVTGTDSTLFNVVLLHPGTDRGSDFLLPVRPERIIRWGGASGGHVNSLLSVHTHTHTHTHTATICLHVSAVSTRCVSIKPLVDKYSFLCDHFPRWSLSCLIFHADSIIHLEITSAAAGLFTSSSPHTAGAPGCYGGPERTTESLCAAALRTSTAGAAQWHESSHALIGSEPTRRQNN